MSTPKVVIFGFKNFETSTKKRRAECKTCGMKVVEKSSTTSNFVRHLKSHPAKYAEYTEVKMKLTPFSGDHSSTSSGQTSVKSFFTKSEESYTPAHPRQRAVTEAIISDLIVKCSLPIHVSLVENEHFRHFLRVVDNKYAPVCRSTVTSKIGSMVSEMQSTIRAKLLEADSVSATVDIWSDRRMRGFLGITAHAVEVTTESINLTSHLLSCNRFKGSHTGEKIAEAFEAVCDEYSIKNKLDYIICDNAANMKRAFTVCFDASADEASDDPEAGQASNYLDDASIWEDLADNEQEDINIGLIRNCRKQRLQCFTHTLQLVVADGLKEAKVVRPALSKASRLSSLLHTSCLFKEAFEKEFGGKGIPAAVCTRWNSTLLQTKAVIGLEHQALCKLLEEQGHKEVSMTPREWSQLKELVEILDPFLEATYLTQGEKTVTVSCVVPCILSLHHYLHSMQQNRQGRYLSSLIRALLDSLKTRFQGIFVGVRMQASLEDPNTLPFGDPLYLMAAVLDPAFFTMWLIHDVTAPDDIKEEVMKFVKELIVTEAQALENSADTSSEDDDGEPPEKASRLFAGYTRSPHNSKTSATAQLAKYLELAQGYSCSDSQGCLHFWSINRKTLEKIFSSRHESIRRSRIQCSH